MITHLSTNSATLSKSSSTKPRLVSAGLPMRRPPGTCRRGRGGQQVERRDQSMSAPRLSHHAPPLHTHTTTTPLGTEASPMPRSHATPPPCPHVPSGLRMGGNLHNPSCEEHKKPPRPLGLTMVDTSPGMCSIPPDPPPLTISAPAHRQGQVPPPPTSTHHGGDVAGDGVLVGGDVGQLQHALNPRAIHALQQQEQQSAAVWGNPRAGSVRLAH